MNVIDTTDLLDELLGEQHSLTAVERFSQKHENAELPTLEKQYSERIPTGMPGSGEQSDDRPLRLSGERNEAHRPSAGALDLEGCRR